MFIIYDLIFLILACVYLPVYLFKRKFHGGFLQRLGILPGNLKLNQPIWVHAVSVGEVAAVKVLIEKLGSSFPGKSVVISTVTATGNKTARTLIGENDLLTYLPFDFSFTVRKVIDKINPSIFIIAETELWPNLIRYLFKKNIPIIVVNGRISDSSFRGYQAVKFLFRPILKRISHFCLQGITDAERIKRLGVSQEKLTVTGNMKFDAAGINQGGQEEAGQEKRLLLGLKPGEKLFVAGSTHPGEEEIVLAAYKKLLAAFPGLKLLIAPRHPQRSADLVEMVSGFGMRPVLVSSLPVECPSCITRPVFILDLIGQLLDYYAAADITFVGGSLVKKGGHNILEPASMGKPVITGEDMHNFRDIAGLFLKEKAIKIARDGEELRKIAERLLSDPAYAQKLGEQGKKVVMNNQGATEKNMGMIKSFYRG